MAIPSDLQPAFLLEFPWGVCLSSFVLTPNILNNYTRDLSAPHASQASHYQELKPIVTPPK